MAIETRYEMDTTRQTLQSETQKKLREGVDKETEIRDLEDNLWDDNDWASADGGERFNPI